MGPRRTITLRAAFSLIELLVVVAILGLLAVAVLPNLSNPSKTEELRQGTGKLSSFIALAQSRAIGASTPQGLVFRQLEGSATAIHGGPALDLAMCEGLAPYSGETYDSRVAVFIPSDPSNLTQYWATDFNANGIRDIGEYGDLNGNGRRDIFNEDVNGNGLWDLGGGDVNGNGVWEPGEGEFDQNKNGALDGGEGPIGPSAPHVQLLFGPTPADFYPSANNDPEFIRTGDHIELQGCSTPFRMRSEFSSPLPNPNWYLFSFRAELRQELGETRANTTWPAEGTPFPFHGSPSTPPAWSVLPASYIRYKIYRQPKVNRRISEQLSGEAVIDTSWTSVGYDLLRQDDPSAPIGAGWFTVRDASFSPGLDLCILFDSIGRPSEVIQIPTAGISSPASFYQKRLTEPVFMLVGRADRVGQNYVSGLNPDVNPDDGCNWQHPDSRWVAIDTNGRVVVAETAPVTSSDWWVALFESQAFIRNDLGAAP